MVAHEATVVVEQIPARLDAAHVSLDVIDVCAIQYFVTRRRGTQNGTVTSKWQPMRTSISSNEVKRSNFSPTTVPVKGTKDLPFSSMSNMKTVRRSDPVQRSASMPSRRELQILAVSRPCWSQ